MAQGVFFLVAGSMVTPSPMLRLTTRRLLHISHAPLLTNCLSPSVLSFVLPSVSTGVGGQTTNSCRLKHGHPKLWRNKEFEYEYSGQVWTTSRQRIDPPEERTFSPRPEPETVHVEVRKGGALNFHSMQCIVEVVPCRGWGGTSFSAFLF